MTVAEDTMRFFQISFHYLGIWSLPSQPRPKSYNVCSNLVHFVVLIVFNVCILLSLFMANSLDDIIGTLLPASCTVVVTVKVLLLRSSRRDFSELMYVMKLLESNSVTSAHDRSILLGAKRKSAMATYFFIFSAFICLLVLLLNTLIQPKRTLLWSSVYPFDWQSNIIWYCVAMIFQVLCTSYILLIVMSVDMWRVAAGFILAGFLDVLRGRMQRLGWSTSTDFKESQLVTADNKQHRLHEKELDDCVIYHLLCLR